MFVGAKSINSHAGLDHDAAIPLITSTANNCDTTSSLSRQSASFATASPLTTTSFPASSFTQQHSLSSTEFIKQPLFTGTVDQFSSLLPDQLSWPQQQFLRVGGELNGSDRCRRDFTHTETVAAEAFQSTQHLPLICSDESNTSAFGYHQLQAPFFGLGHGDSQFEADQSLQMNQHQVLESGQVAHFLQNDISYLVSADDGFIQQQRSQSEEVWSGASSESGARSESPYLSSTSAQSQYEILEEIHRECAQIEERYSSASPPDIGVMFFLDRFYLDR